MFKLKHKRLAAAVVLLTVAFSGTAVNASVISDAFSVLADANYNAIEMIIDQNFENIPEDKLDANLWDYEKAKGKDLRITDIGSLRMRLATQHSRTINGAYNAADDKNAVKFVKDPTNSENTVLAITADSTLTHSSGAAVIPFVSIHTDGISDIKNTVYANGKTLYVSGRVYISEDDSKNLTGDMYEKDLLFGIRAADLEKNNYWNINQNNSATNNDTPLSYTNFAYIGGKLQYVISDWSTGSTVKKAYDTTAGEWHTIEYCIRADENGKAQISEYVDGVLYNITGRTTINNFNYIMLSPGVKFTKDGKTYNTTVYYDDLKAALVSPFENVTEIAAADENGSLDINFTTPVKNISKDLLTVKDADGNNVSDAIKSVSVSSGGLYATIVLNELSQNLYPDSEYELYFSKDITDTFRQNFSGSEFITFTSHEYEKRIIAPFAVSTETIYANTEHMFTLEFSNEINTYNASDFSAIDKDGNKYDDVFVSAVLTTDKKHITLTYDYSKLSPYTAYTVSFGDGFTDADNQTISAGNAVFVTNSFEVDTDWLFNDDFSMYVENENWIYNAPSGWYVTNGTAKPYCDGNRIEVVKDNDDETNKILKITGGFQDGTENAYVTRIPLDSSIDRSKNLFISADVYIPSSEAGNFKDNCLILGIPASDGQTKMWESYSSIMSRLGSSSFRVPYQNNDKSFTLSASVDKWITMQFVIDTAHSENAEIDTYKFYIDGKVQNSGLTALPLCYNASKGTGKLLTGFYGLQSSVIAASKDVRPYIYLDNVKAKYIYEFKPIVNVTGKVSEKQNIDLSFMCDVSSDDMDKIVSTLSVKGENGKNVEFNSTVSGSKISIEPKHGWEYGGKKYKITINKADVYDEYHQVFNGFEYEFTTKEAEEIYVSDAKYTVSGNELSLNAEIKNPGLKNYAITACTAAYGENGKLIGKNFDEIEIEGKNETSSYTANVTLNDENVKYVYVYLFEVSNGTITRLYQKPFGINPNNYEIPSVSEKSESLSAKICDPVLSLVKVTGRINGGSANKTAVIIAVPTGKSFLDYSDIKMLTFASADTDGYYSAIAAFSDKKGTYDVYVLSDGSFTKTTFNYVPSSDVAAALNNIKSGSVAQDNVYDYVIEYNDGIGIDENEFASVRNKALFNKRISQKLKGSENLTDAEIISLFSETVSGVSEEIKFLDKLKNVSYWTDVVPILKSNTKFADIDFTDYDLLSPDNKKYVSDIVSKADAADGDAVKKLFDEKVSEKKETSDTSTGGSKSSGSSSGGKVMTPVIVDDNTRSDRTEFDDMQGFEWAKESVDELVKRKIVSGTGNNKYAPEGYVTREQFIKMAVLAFEKYDSNAKCEFSDVSSDDWYYPFVASAVNAGIISGMGDNLFGSGNAIAREDMAVIINRILAYQTDKTAGFNDVDNISDYAAGAVNALYENKILSGDENGNFNPKSSATRAETAVVIMRVINALES